MTLDQKISFMPSIHNLWLLADGRAGQLSPPRFTTKSAISWIPRENYGSRPKIPCVICQVWPQAITRLCLAGSPGEAALPMPDLVHSQYIWRALQSRTQALFGPAILISISAFPAYRHLYLEASLWLGGGVVETLIKYFHQELGQGSFLHLDSVPFHT